MSRRRAVLALMSLVLVGGAVGGCSGPDRSGVGAGAGASASPGDPAGGVGPGGPGGSGASGGPAGSGTSDDAVGGSGPNTTDIAWLQLLIAMNERLLPIFDLVPARSSDPAVQLYASVARRARAAELESLRKLTAGVNDMPSDNPHLRHDMPGMPTAAQRDALARASGKDFDRAFAAVMIAHLDQTSRLCAGEQKSGADPDFRSLAESIARGVGEERARASALDARAASPTANTR